MTKLASGWKRGALNKRVTIKFNDKKRGSLFFSLSPPLSPFHSHSLSLSLLRRMIYESHAIIGYDNRSPSRFKRCRLMILDMTRHRCSIKKENYLSVNSLARGQARQDSSPLHRTACTHSWWPIPFRWRLCCLFGCNEVCKRSLRAIHGGYLARRVDLKGESKCRNCRTTYLSQFSWKWNANTE